MERKSINKILIILLALLFVGIIGFVIYKYVIVKETTEEENKDRYFECSKPEIEQDGYSVTEKYSFYFELNTLKEGSTSIVVNFDDKALYDEYKLNTSSNVKYEENFDEETLTKTYRLYYMIPQKTEGDNAIEEYTNTLEEQGWTCAEDFGVDLLPKTPEID